MTGNGENTVTGSACRQSSPQSFVVEKGVPYSAQRSEQSAEIWRAMLSCDVGDSFYVDLKERKCGAITMLVHRHGQKMGRHFSIRTQGNGIRVWRTR